MKRTAATHGPPGSTAVKMLMTSALAKLKRKISLLVQPGKEPVVQVALLAKNAEDFEVSFSVLPGRVQGEPHLAPLAVGGRFT